MTSILGGVDRIWVSLARLEYTVKAGEGDSDTSDRLAAWRLAHDFVLNGIHAFCSVQVVQRHRAGPVVAVFGSERWLIAGQGDILPRRDQEHG